METNTEDSNFYKPYISLKFGRLKSINFNGNEEAKIIYDQYHNDEFTKEQMIEVIKAYNGNFYFWWANRWGTKQEAIDYILNYKEVK